MSAQLCFWQAVTTCGCNAGSHRGLTVPLGKVLSIRQAPCALGSTENRRMWRRARLGPRNPTGRAKPALSLPTRVATTSPRLLRLLPAARTSPHNSLALSWETRSRNIHSSRGLLLAQPLMQFGPPSDLPRSGCRTKTSVVAMTASEPSV